jgi:hypothetical protein
MDPVTVFVPLSKPIDKYFFSICPPPYTSPASYQRE